MRFRYYQGARNGIMGTLNSLGSAGAQANSSYNDTLRTLAGVDAARSSAGKDRAETSILDDQLHNRQSVPEALRHVELPPGWTPEAVAATYLSNKNPDFKNLTEGMQAAQDSGIQRQAIDAATGANGQPANTEVGNILSTYRKAGEPYMPFRGGEFGTVNQSTGAFAPSAANTALATDRNASARAHDAAAGASNALAEQRKVLPVGAGQSVYAVTDLIRNWGQPQGAPAAQPPETAVPSPELIPQDPERPQGLPFEPPTSVGAILGGLQPPQTGPQPLVTAPGKAAGTGAPVEVYDATSPTGTRLVAREDAIGKPGKAGKANAPAGYRVDPSDPARLIPIPGGPGDPMTKPLSEGQSKAVMFATRADAMDKQLGSSKYDPTGKWGAFDRATAGGMLTNWMASKDGQTYINQGKNFVAAVLRKESGATITESEWESGQQLYVPMPGDSKEVIAQKKYNRALAIDGIKAEAGNAMGRVKVPMPPSDAGQMPPPTNAKGWPLHQDASGNFAYIGPNGEIEEVR